ncbi:MAG: protein kinase [Alphaproteobacteria bacterium]|nr:protein kinase [Alphaproteobacteria bacterium]
MSELPPPMQPVPPPSPRTVLPFAPHSVLDNPATGTSYRLLRPIGEGHFGIVYAAIDTWENELAIKVLKPQPSPQEDANKAAAEIDKLVMLRSPYLTYIYEAFAINGYYCIVTERCEHPLSAALGQPWFKGPNSVRSVARCLLQAVQRMHDFQLVHQDIHLDNVFVAVTRDALVGGPAGATTFKLGDVGLAKPVHQLNPFNTNVNPETVAPEFLDPAAFGTPDHRVDIYHCGLLLLQVLVGERLRFTPDQIRAAAPAHHALSLGTPLGAALAEALHRRVGRRYASARDFWTALAPAAVAS